MIPFLCFFDFLPDQKVFIHNIKRADLFEKHSFSLILYFSRMTAVKFVAFTTILINLSAATEFI